MTDTFTGSNIQAPYGEVLTERLDQDYAALTASVDDAITLAAKLPSSVTSRDDVATVSEYVIRLKDLKGQIEHHRVAEKEPYLRGGTIIDAFFKSMVDVVEPLRRKLAARVDDYKQEQLRIERLEREALAREARKREAEARRAREEAERAAQEIEEKLRRARSRAKIDEHEQAADEAEIASEVAKAEERASEMAAQQAQLHAQVKPAEMVRERFEGPERSGMVTMKRAAFVMIEDYNLLDLERLRAFFKPEHFEYACRAWAKATNYEETMPGTHC